MLNIEKTIENGIAVISLSGRLDTVTSPELTEELNALSDDVTSVTLDFEGLEYISSAGLRVLLSAHKKYAERGGMKLCRVNETISEIFEITGFSDFLTVE